MTATFTKIDDAFRSRVMKAAGKIFRERYTRKTLANWSKALKLAWTWAKEKLLAPTMAGHTFRRWSPEDGFSRYYFDDGSYIQTRRSAPRGYYARHRACKGDYSACDIHVTVSGAIAATVLAALPAGYFG